MTRALTRLADFSYRRRGTVVLIWLAAMVGIIGIGSSLAGEYNADYNTPGSDSKAAGELTEKHFDGYSGQEIYVVWKDERGAQSAGAKQRLDGFFSQAERVKHVAPHTAIRVSDDGKIASTTLPLTVPGWDVEKAQGEQLIAAADGNSGDGLQIKLGGDPIYAAQEQSSPEGLGFLGAATVVVAVLGLLLTGLSYMYGVALSASLAVLVMMLASVTLLPALLSYLGPRVDRLRLPLIGRRRRQTSENGRSLARFPTPRRSRGSTCARHPLRQAAECMGCADTGRPALRSRGEPRGADDQDHARVRKPALSGSRSVTA